MSQDLVFGFPIPVVLAFGALVLVLLAVARVLVAMGRPVPVRDPCSFEPCDAEQEETAWPF